MRISRVSLFITAVLVFSACKKTVEPVYQPDKPGDTETGETTGRRENPGSFSQISFLDIGDVGAAEITAFCEKSKKLFVVNNASGNNRIDVIDFSDPLHPVYLTNIPVAIYGGLVNSVDVKNGKLAAAIEAIPKTNPGKVVVFETSDYQFVREVTVGALPDMITYSPDGKLILTANEGEPSSDYSIDPPGTVSVIDVQQGYSVTTLDFSSFASQEATLVSRGLRKFGPGASFAQDMEPEYLTVSSDSRTAWVTLQENNGVAKIDLRRRTITDIFPLGFKNYNLAPNAIDPSDRPLGTLQFNPWPVKGVYMPDAIAVLEEKEDRGESGDNRGIIAERSNEIPYLFTANEGDAREYSTFVEEIRVGASGVVLDPVIFPNAATLKLQPNLGRLNITSTLGKNPATGWYETLYSFGARSFSIWNGNTGVQVFDSKNELEQKAVLAGYYDDDRSDSKGVEPEGIAVGKVGKKSLVFVGMERADAVAIYDVTNPLQPAFLQILPTGDAPEGILFISAKESPNKRSLLVVSSENDGVIRVYMPSEN